MSLSYTHRQGGMAEASALPLHDPLLPRSVGAGDASHNSNSNRHGAGRGHPIPHQRRRTHSLPLGSTAVDVRAVARRGFKPLREATPVLCAWGALCVACLVLVLLPAGENDSDGGGDGGAAARGAHVRLGPFKDYRVRASLNTALLLASGALELVLRVVLKRRQRQGYLGFYRDVRNLLLQPFRVVAFGTAALLLVVALTLPPAPVTAGPPPPHPTGGGGQ
jgi:hypothetical protein